MIAWPNWVDLIVLTIIIRTGYRGSVTGFLTELLNVVGAVAVTAFTVNFAPVVAGWLRSLVWFSPPIAAVLGFWLVFFGLWFCVRVMRKRLADVIKWDRLHWVIQILGLSLGALRGLWWSGFILLTLSSSGYAVLQDSVEQRSLTGSRVVTAFHARLEQVADRFPGAEHRGSVLVPPIQPIIAVPWHPSSASARSSELV